MRGVMIALCCIAGIGQALAEPCPGNPDALGTSRIVVVDGSKLPFIGNMHYPTTVPLEDHEVLLTFDDGPRPPYTDQILAALAHECVKATFFEVGYMVRANPQTTRRVYNEGHSIGSHSQNHVAGFGGLGLPGIEKEVGGGFATLAAALGDPRAVSTFFRAPGLAQNRTLNPYLAARATSLWSTDTHAWDWKGLQPAEIIRRTLAMLEAKGHRGVVLLHDLQPSTAMAMPALLKALKANGYKIVHAVAPGERPKTVPEPNGAAPQVAQQGWPRTVPVPAHAALSDKTPGGSVAAGLVDGRSALPLVAPAKTDPDITNSVSARRPAWLIRSAPPKKHNPTPAAWTLIGRS
jgi:peptidoglycan/xylan/chitin deacetylase (PgdA/CDA1 family)